MEITIIILKILRIVICILVGYCLGKLYRKWRDKK